MLFNYIHGVMLTILEMICCKIFFEIFSEKRSKNYWRNISVIIGLITSVYLLALFFYEQFYLKQILVVAVIALFIFFDIYNIYNYCNDHDIR